MRITFLAPCKDLSGGIKVIATYAELLRQRGHQVSVVYPQRPLPLKRRLKRFAFRKLRLERDHLDDFGGALLPVQDVNDASMPDADVLVATAWETAEWAAGLSPSKGRPFYLIQGHEVWNAPADRVHATYGLPFQKVAISQWLSQLVSQHSGGFVPVISNGVDAIFRQPNPTPESRQYDAGFVYSVIPNKGSDLSLAAIKSLAKNHPDRHFVIFGTEAPTESLPKNTTVHVRPSRKTIASIYAQTRVWLSSSYEEGFCLPCLEAMTSGCAVVSTDNKGVRDIIQHGRSGFITVPGRAQDLAAHAQRLLSNPEEIAAMRQAGLNRSHHFDWQHAVTEFEQVLKQSVIKKAA